MEELRKSTTEIPRYQQIAIEIASRIAREEYKVGEKIYARSSIASQYGVSPETARRAICVLCDLEIVSSEKGSGVTIKSTDNAEKFIKQFSKRQTIDSIKENIQQSILRQREEMEVMNQHLSELITASEHFRSFNPFMPYEIVISKHCTYLGKNIAELQFWQHTGATVIAIKRGETTMVSPGPYAMMKEHDIIYFITQDDTPIRVKNFLYPSKAEEG